MSLNAIDNTKIRIINMTEVIIAEILMLYIIKLHTHKTYNSLLTKRLFDKFVYRIFPILDWRHQTMFSILNETNFQY